jgi:pimeloyl-ACP methyl ester carboxylesterase
LTVDELQRLEPDLTVLAVDLPGRRGKPGDLGTLTIADWVESAVRDIEEAELNDVVIVAHSMAGLTAPGVLTRLGASRVREMVLATAFVPPEGSSMADTLPWPGGPTARRNAKRGTPSETSAMMARFVLLNGVPRARRRFMSGRIYPESSRIMAEKVSRSDMPEDIPRTWILTLRDRALSAKSQRRSIHAIGGVQTLIPMDTCHCLMVSEPERLAEILVERCRLRAS